MASPFTMKWILEDLHRIRASLRYGDSNQRRNFDGRRVKFQMDLTCQWCGEHGPAEEFDLDEQNHEGLWCPSCDGFTYYDDSKNHLRRILLILEQYNR